MFRKNYISLLLFIALFAVGSISTFAQKSAGGKIELKDTKGKKTAVVGAKIDCYRIDVKESCGSTISDDKGKFKFEGLPKESVLVFAASGAGISPLVVPDIRFDDTNTLNALEGDGSVASEESVRLTALQYAKGKGKLTDAQKVELEEFEKKLAEREANNAKKKDFNKYSQQYIKEAEAAEKNKQYDVAAEKYKMGYELDKEFMGSAPGFLNSRAQALKNHAIVIFNTANKKGDSAGIGTARVEAVKLFSEALSTVTKSFNMSKNASSSEIINPKSHKNNIKNSVIIAKSILSVMTKMKVSLGTYIADEKGAKEAVQIFRDTLVMIPGDPDAIAGLAFSLYLAGDFLGDKARKQESLNYWAEYKKIAEKNHSQQPVADEVMDILTTEEKLKPQPLK